MVRFLGAALIAGALVSGLPLAEAQAQQPARNSMEQCVDRVLTRLARENSADAAVGRTVVTQCDKELKATLEEAIRRGEASSCTVEKCIQVARDQAAREAREEFRNRTGR